VETFSSLLPLPLERQNIPDGCIIPCYPQNTKFLAPNDPPTVSAPPGHCFWHCLHVFTDAPYPCPYYTPTLASGTPGISTILPTQPNNPITNPNQPWHYGRTFKFWVVGNTQCGLMKSFRQVLGIDTSGYQIQVFQRDVGSSSSLDKGFRERKPQGGTQCVGGPSSASQQRTKMNIVVRFLHSFIRFVQLTASTRQATQRRLPPHHNFWTTANHTTTHR